MAVPKRRTSKMKKRLRRSGNRWRPSQLQKCPQCESAKPGHTACPSCGYYNGRQVVTVDDL